MAMTPAEKQRRYRERIRAGQRPARWRKPQDRRSAPQRWRDAVAELLDLQARWTEIHDELPEGMAGSEYGQRLAEVASLDLSEIEAIEPPRGYGRD